MAVRKGGSAQRSAARKSAKRSVRRSVRRSAVRKSVRRSAVRSVRRSAVRSVRRSARRSVRRSATRKSATRKSTTRRVSRRKGQGSASQAGTSRVNLYDINTQIRMALDSLQDYDDTTARNYSDLILEYVRTRRQYGQRITLDEFYNYLDEIEYPNLDYLDDLANLIAPDYD